jgi:hypothetical protein
VPLARLLISPVFSLLFVANHAAGRYADNFRSIARLARHIAEVKLFRLSEKAFKFGCGAVAKPR